MVYKEELINIEGGVSFSAALLNAFVRGLNSLLEVGRSLGTAIRRISSKSKCSI